MTSGDLPSPPEGKLLRSARERAIPKITIRAAAARIGISPEHWGNIERGYKSVSADEPPVQVEASAELMAKMAAAAGVTPEQMATEGQRPDAAEILREIVRQQGTTPEPPPLPRATPEMEAAMDDHVLEYRIAAKVARSAHPGERLTGEMVFPDSPAAAWFWDYLAARGWDEAKIPAGVAAGMTLDEQTAELRGNDSAAGLDRSQFAGRAGYVTTRERSALAEGKTMPAVR